MKRILGMVMAAALITPAAAGSNFAPLAPRLSDGQPAIQVRDGCGPGYFRNYYGHCRPEQWEPDRRYMRLECPRGFHLGPEGRRCWPN